MNPPNKLDSRDDKKNANNYFRTKERSQTKDIGLCHHQSNIKYVGQSPLSNLTTKISQPVSHRHPVSSKNSSQLSVKERIHHKDSSSSTSDLLKNKLKHQIPSMSSSRVPLTCRSTESTKSIYTNRSRSVPRNEFISTNITPQTRLHNSKITQSINHSTIPIADIKTKKNDGTQQICGTTMSRGRRIDIPPVSRPVPFGTTRIHSKTGLDKNKLDRVKTRSSSTIMHRGCSVTKHNSINKNEEIIAKQQNDLPTGTTLFKSSSKRAVSSSAREPIYKPRIQPVSRPTQSSLPPIPSKQGMLKKKVIQENQLLKNKKSSIIKSKITCSLHNSDPKYPIRKIQSHTFLTSLPLSQKKNVSNTITQQSLTSQCHNIKESHNEFKPLLSTSIELKKKCQQLEELTHRNSVILDSTDLDIFKQQPLTVSPKTITDHVTLAADSTTLLLNDPPVISTSETVVNNQYPVTLSLPKTPEIQLKSLPTSLMSYLPLTITRSSQIHSRSTIHSVTPQRYESTRRRVRRDTHRQLGDWMSVVDVVVAEKSYGTEHTLNDSISVEVLEQAARSLGSLGLLAAGAADYAASTTVISETTDSPFNKMESIQLHLPNHHIPLSSQCNSESPTISQFKNSPLWNKYIDFQLEENQSIACHPHVSFNSIEKDISHFNSPCISHSTPLPQQSHRMLDAIAQTHHKKDNVSQTPVVLLQDDQNDKTLLIQSPHQHHPIELTHSLSLVDKNKVNNFHLHIPDVSNVSNTHVSPKIHKIIDYNTESHNIKPFKLTPQTIKDIHSTPIQSTYYHSFKKRHLPCKSDSNVGQHMSGSSLLRAPRQYYHRARGLLLKGIRIRSPELVIEAIDVHDADPNGYLSVHSSYVPWTIVAPIIMMKSSLCPDTLYPKKQHCHQYPSTMNSYLRLHPLHLASVISSPGVVQTLLKYGSCANALDEWYRNPLHVLLQPPPFPIPTHLLQQIEKENQNNETIHEARNASDHPSKQTDTISLNDNDLNYSNVFQTLSLFLIKQTAPRTKTEYQIASMLCQAGIDLNREDIWGRTCSDYISDWTQIERLIRSRHINYHYILQLTNKQLIQHEIKQQYDNDSHYPIVDNQLSSHPIPIKKIVTPMNLKMGTEQLAARVPNELIDVVVLYEDGLRLDAFRSIVGIDAGNGKSPRNLVCIQHRPQQKRISIHHSTTPTCHVLSSIEANRQSSKKNMLLPMTKQMEGTPTYTISITPKTPNENDRVDTGGTGTQCHMSINTNTRTSRSSCLSVASLSGNHYSNKTTRYHENSDKIMVITSPQSRFSVTLLPPSVPGITRVSVRSSHGGESNYINSGKKPTTIKNTFNYTTRQTEILNQSAYNTANTPKKPEELQSYLATSCIRAIQSKTTSSVVSGRPSHEPENLTTMCPLHCSNKSTPLLQSQHSTFSPRCDELTKFFQLASTPAHKFHPALSGIWEFLGAKIFPNEEELSDNIDETLLINNSSDKPQAAIHPLCFSPLPVLLHRPFGTN